MKHLFRWENFSAATEEALLPDKDGHRTHWTMPEAPWKRDPQGVVPIVENADDPRPWKKAKLRAYLAGPMTGRQYFNFPAFDAAAAVLRAAGWEVFSPAEHDRSVGLNELDYPTGDLRDLPASFSLRSSFKWDMDQLFEVDAIALLDGHEGSTGARAELAVARMLKLRELRFVYDDVTNHIFDYYEVKR